MAHARELEAELEEALHTKSVGKAKALMQTRSGTALLALISFIESALPLPLLTDPFLAAAILLNRAKAIRLVVVTTLASVAGGLVAYALAFFFFEVLLQWLSPTVTAELHALTAGNGANTFVLTIVGALTPVPYTVVAWAAAVIDGGWAVFMFASFLGRGLRYVIVGYATYRFGPLAVAYTRRYLGAASVLALLLAAAYIWYKM